MTPEERARQLIDARLAQSGWVVQDLKKVNPMASLGVAVREYPTSTGPVDYALFVDGKPVGVIEAKKDELGENITVVEGQSGRYANSTFKYITTEYKIALPMKPPGSLPVSRIMLMSSIAPGVYFPSTGRKRCLLYSQRAIRSAIT